MQGAQSCDGWAGLCGAGGVLSSAWQIGILPVGSVPAANGASDIVASKRIWHHAASIDAANPSAVFGPRKGTVALCSINRHTGHTQPLQRNK